jgi:hypothetical protein
MFLGFDGNQNPAWRNQERIIFVVASPIIYQESVTYTLEPIEVSRLGCSLLVLPADDLKQFDTILPNTQEVSLYLAMGWFLVPLELCTDLPNDRISKGLWHLVSSGGSIHMQRPLYCNGGRVMDMLTDAKQNAYKLSVDQQNKLLALLSEGVNGE